MCFCRSITLVGEKERKLLKDVIKSAKCPVKSRVISSGELLYQLPIDGCYNWLCVCMYVGMYVCVFVCLCVCMCGMYVCVCSCVVEVIARYRDRIRKLEQEIHEILKVEEEEKQVCGCKGYGLDAVLARRLKMLAVMCAPYTLVLSSAYLKWK